MTSEELRRYHDLIKAATDALRDAKAASDRADVPTYLALLRKSQQCSDEARLLLAASKQPTPPPVTRAAG